MVFNISQSASLKIGTKVVGTTGAVVDTKDNGKTPLCDRVEIKF